MKDLPDLLTDDRVVYYAVVAVVCVLLFNLFVWGCFSFFIVVTAVGCGHYIFELTLKKSDSDKLHSSKNKVNNAAVTNTCNNCGDCVSCNKNIKCAYEQTPWNGLLIPEQIDSSIDKLLSKIIKVYISSWYDNITEDPSLIKEIKQVVRFATSVLLKRLLQLNVEEIILNKVLPICLSHIRHCQQTEKGQNVGHHYAITNRNVEIKYLKKVTECLLPFLTQKNDLQCKIFITLIRELLSLWVLLPISDVICNPINITAVWSKLSKSSIISANMRETSVKVEFLSKFVSEDQNETVQLEMRRIFKDSTILSAFMDFLKQNDAIHLLQFCLDVDQFNKRMLRPEISSQELDMLYRDAWDIFSVYFSSHSPDCINFDPELVSQLRKVLSKDVIKLQNSKPLYQAYEQTYSILENKYWIDFHNSDEYFAWVSGPRYVNNTYSSQESLLNDGKKNHSSKLNRKLNRLKGALKSSPIYDGQIDSLSSECEAEYGEDLSVDSEILNDNRDLSLWKVTDITSAMKLESGSNGGQSLVFFICVETKENNVIKQWCVERRLADFYTLKSKLTEFHGVFLDAQLPPRRMLMQKTENNDVYMQFLNQLLQTPELRGSDLLHMFLKSVENFEDSESAFGKLLRKSMPTALRKERGQNLESFISIFMNSIETKLKQRFEWKDFNEESSPHKVKTVENTMFGNNLNIVEDENQIPFKDVSSRLLDLCGPINCIIFVGVYVYNVSNAVVRLVLAIKSICGNVLDSVLQRYISVRIVQSITPSKVAYLIDLLENLLFPRDDVFQKTVNHQTSCDLMESLKNSVFLPLYMCLFKCTQNAVMNKQLFYRLLDVLIEETFPELHIQLNEQL